MIRKLPFALLVVAITVFPSAALSQQSFDVADVYKRVDVPFGAVALTSSGQLEDINAILVPTTLDIGTYELTVNRKGQDLYEVVGYGIFIRTRFCFTFGFSKRALLKYESRAGYSKGKLVFLD